MKRTLIEPGNQDIGTGAQCAALGLARSSYYYRPVPESAENLRLMRFLDEQWLKTPFYGVRRMQAALRAAGFEVNEKRTRRLLRLMGLSALGPAPGLSAACPAAEKYPYLLKGLEIKEPNHVWCTDITYIPMERGFLYLCAVMDWATRFVLSWRLSSTLDVGFCLEALEEAHGNHGRPLIFNTDQGSQFTSAEWTGWLKNKSVLISMDGKGRATDNAFIERLWRSLKYECVYLNAFADGGELARGLASYFSFYNHERLHQSLGYTTPAHAYSTMPLFGRKEEF